MPRTNVQKVGEFLKRVRELSNQTLAEVSGAVEIDLEQLRFIESGHALPTEEVLVTLISYFNIDDIEAKLLFKQAGYYDPEDEKPEAKNVIPALYADSVRVVRSNDGVVLDFKQPNTEGSFHTFRFGINDRLAKDLIKQIMLSLSDSNIKKLSDGRD